MITFEPFPKMARFSRDVIVTEKIDGTNAQVIIEEVPTQATSDGYVATINLTDEGSDYSTVTFADDGVADGKLYLVAAASRTRLIKPGKDTDNYGFAAWVKENAKELAKLGPGRHFGEWWGTGIQRNYGLNERRFSLFNVSKWVDSRDPVIGCAGLAEGELVAPACCHVVPVIWKGPFAIGSASPYDNIMWNLKRDGSAAAPGFMNPEGIVIFHTAARVCFKKTFEKDTEGKGLPDTGKEAA